MLVVRRLERHDSPLVRALPTTQVGHRMTVSYLDDGPGPLPRRETLIERIARLNRQRTALEAELQILTAALNAALLEQARACTR